MAEKLPGFEDFEHTDDGRTRTVYWTGSGPPVLLLHELPGMVPECVDLGRQLAASGFSVYLPLMFGRPNQRIGVSDLLCISREFTLWRAGRTSPIVTWLRGLSRALHERHPGRRMGVIGMCLTGSFALLLMPDDWVAAPVLSQPSLPMRPSWLPGAWCRSIDLPAAEIASARAAAEDRDLQVLGFRFDRDRICPRERFLRLGEIFGARFEPVTLPGAKHSVFTLHYMSLPPAERERVWTRLISFLQNRLARSEAPA